MCPGNPLGWLLLGLFLYSCVPYSTYAFLRARTGTLRLRPGVVAVNDAGSGRRGGSGGNSLEARRELGASTTVRSAKKGV